MNLSIFLILCFTSLALTSTKAFEETTIKSLLFFDPLHDASTTLFRTKRGSITYNGQSENGKSLEYLLIDFKPVNATTILKDISQACDLNAYTFSKLHYHEQTSSLVYYCAANNTLLILDQDTFKVQSTIYVDLNITLEETRISDDGNAIAIVGMNQFYHSTHPPSRLIIINLNTRTVTTNLIFDKVTDNSQALVAFASSGLRKFILISGLLDKNIILDISEIVLLGNTFKLISLSRVSYQRDVSPAKFYVPELFFIQNLIITNTKNEIKLFNTLGGLVSTIPGLQFRACNFNKTFPNLPLIGRGQANKVFYANILGQVNRYIVDGTSITSDILTSGFNTQFARGTSQQQGDLIFNVQRSAGNDSFQVLNVTSLKNIYFMPNSYSKLMSSNSTYAILSSSTLSIYNLTDDTLLNQFNLALSTTSQTALPPYYYDANNAMLYVLRQKEKDICNFISIDLQTATLESWGTTQSANICPGRIIQVSSPGSSQNVIQNQDGSFLIFSENYGFTDFIPPQEFQSSFITVNFSTLSVKLVGNRQRAHGGWNLAYFEYNDQTGNFTMTSCSQLLKMDLIDGRAFYLLQEDIIYAPTGSILAIINTTSSSVSTYPSFFAHAFPSVLQDQSVIFSDDLSRNLSGSPPLLISPGGNVGPLPGSTASTVGAVVTGPSTYSTSDGRGSSVSLVKFHRINQSTLQKIYI